MVHLGDVTARPAGENQFRRRREGSVRMIKGTSEAVFTAVIVLVLLAIFLAGMGAAMP
jgi:hypothetical protein